MRARARVYVCVFFMFIYRIFIYYKLRALLYNVVDEN